MVKAKSWFTILAPTIFGAKELGFTLAKNPKELVQRKVEIVLANLVEDRSKYAVKIKLKVQDVKDDKAFTKFNGSECFEDYLKLVVTKGTSRIDSVQDVKLKDAILRVKNLAITDKISKKLRSKLRKLMMEETEKLCQGLSLDDFVVNHILNEKLKKHIMKKARKLKPLKFFEIRKTQVLKYL